MGPLALGLCVDFYLIARDILHAFLASLLATAVFAVFVTLRM
jgi:hypothetical protein